MGAEVTEIYLVSAPSVDGDGWGSLERRADAPAELVGHATAADAVRAVAFGEPVLPAPFIGDGPVDALSDLPVTELGLRLLDLADEVGHGAAPMAGTDRDVLRISIYGDEVRLQWRGWDQHRFLGELPPEQLRRFLALFPYRNDSTLVGRPRVLRVEVED